MKKSWIVIFILLLPIIYSASFSNYRECSVSYGECNDLKVDLNSKTIEFNVIFSSLSRYNSLINQITLTETYSTTSQIICTDVSWGKNSDNLGKTPITVNPQDKIYIKATGCNVQPDKWIKAYIRMNGDRQINGQIYKFVESPSYKQKQLMNRIFYRFIPLMVILIISLAGLKRIKR